MALPLCSADVKANQVTHSEGRLPRLTPTLLCGPAERPPWGQEQGTDSTLQSHLSFSSCMSLPPTLKAKMSLLVLTYLSFSLVRSGESWGPKRPGRGTAGEKSRRDSKETKHRQQGKRRLRSRGRRTIGAGGRTGEQPGCVQLESAPTAFSPACQAAGTGSLLQGIPAAGQRSGQEVSPFLPLKAEGKRSLDTPGLRADGLTA